MADVEPSVFKILTSYGGQKRAYFEVDVCTAADVLKLADSGVAGIKIAYAQLDTTRANVPMVPAGTGDVDLTIGAGPSAAKIVGEVVWRSY